MYKSDNRRLKVFPRPRSTPLFPRRLAGFNPRGHNLLFGGRGASSAREELPIMVYDWDGKREICYQMYIRDKKALEEIMEYMKTTHQFAPR